MAGKSLGQRDKEGVPVAPHAHGPVGSHIHPTETRVEAGTIVPGVPKDCVYKASERRFM